MYISFGDKSEDFSLVIPSVTDDHSGDYSCISTSLELQYLLVLCPKKNPQEKFDIVGGDVLLECKVGQADSQKVQWWYHRQTTEEPELIHDSNDLRGRLTLSDNGSSLTISNVKMTDAGLYWCVVLRDPNSKAFYIQLTLTVRMKSVHKSHLYQTVMKWLYIYMYFHVYAVFLFFFS
uniref:Ig-like domain-containing protein n=1 Tax=Lates calcarifer TaxID=8187 RepID=A0A4W6ET22_LATCA